MNSNCFFFLNFFKGFKLNSQFNRITLDSHTDTTLNSRNGARKMLHELLLALLGYTGDLIIDEREHQNSPATPLSGDAPISEECSFKLAPDISFIEPSERYIHDKQNKCRHLFILFSFARVSFATWPNGAKFF